MPEAKTLERAAVDKRKGKAPSTQAGEYVRGEMDHIRHGKHGAKSAKQAIAIGLSKARKSGVKLSSPKNKKSKTKRKSKPSAKRSKATLNALKKEPHKAASHRALSRQASSSVKKRRSSQAHAN